MQPTISQQDSLRFARSDKGISKLDLTFFMEDDGQMSLVIEYSTELFKEETIEAMKADLGELLGHILRQRGQQIDHLLWLFSNESEKNLLRKNLSAISEDF